MKRFTLIPPTPTAIIIWAGCFRMGQRKEPMQEFAEIKRLAREKQPPMLLSQIGGAKRGTKPDRTSAAPDDGKH